MLNELIFIKDERTDGQSYLLRSLREYFCHMVEHIACAIFSPLNYENLSKYKGLRSPG